MPLEGIAFCGSIYYNKGNVSWFPNREDATYKLK